MRKFLLLFLTVVVFNQVHGQQKSTFSTQLNIGALEGENGTAFQFQVIPGMMKKNWFAGLGAGIDYYRIRSIPVFVSLQRFINIKSHPFFIQGDGGLNFAWNQKERSMFNDFVSLDFSPGFYWNASLGYSKKLGLNGDALMISLGYSYKRISEIRETPVFCINPPCEPVTEKFAYYLNRLSMKIGWTFMSGSSKK